MERCGGQDKPESRRKAASEPLSSDPSGPDYKVFAGSSLPADAIATANHYQHKAGKYSMSESFGALDIKKYRVTHFNDLDRLEDTWRVKSLTFYLEKLKYISRICHRLQIRRTDQAWGMSGRSCHWQGAGQDCL